jgi:membrane protease subunit (stomatin/prohibitin family)
LYTNVAGNVSNEYTCAELDDQLKEEFISALQPGLGRLSELELRPNQLISHTRELEEAMKAELSADWTERRGLAIVKIALSSVTIPPEESELLKEAQKNAQKARFLTDPSIAGATLVGAQADALKAAASNTAGAMTGFMGMNMAMNAGGMGGGMNAADFFAMGQQQKQQQAQQQKVQQPAANSWTCSCGATATGKFCPECGSKKPEPKMQAGWKCSCGATATGKFCPECGSKKPADDGWTCSCGAVNKGKFCPECGARKPAGVPQYKCDKCGWEPVKGVKPPRFCPECGDPFDDGDLV